MAFLDSESRSLQATELYDAMGMQGDAEFEFVVQLWQRLLAGHASAKPLDVEPDTSRRVVPGALVQTEGSIGGPRQLNSRNKPDFMRVPSSPAAAGETNPKASSNRTVVTIAATGLGHNLDGAQDQTAESYRQDIPPTSLKPPTSGEGTQHARSSGSDLLNRNFCSSKRELPPAFDVRHVDANPQGSVTEDEPDRRKRRKKTRFARSQPDKALEPDNRNTGEVEDSRGLDDWKGPETKEKSLVLRDLKESLAVNSRHTSHASRENELYDRRDARESRHPVGIDAQAEDERSRPRRYHGLRASEFDYDDRRYRRAKHMRGDISPELGDAAGRYYWHGDRNQGLESSAKRHERGGYRDRNLLQGPEYDPEHTRRERDSGDRSHHEFELKSNRCALRVSKRYAPHDNGGNGNLAGSRRRLGSTSSRERSFADEPFSRPSRKLARSWVPEPDQSNPADLPGDFHANRFSAGLQHQYLGNKSLNREHRSAEWNSLERRGGAKNWDTKHARDGDVIGTLYDVDTSARPSGETLAPAWNARPAGGSTANGSSRSVGDGGFSVNSTGEDDIGGRSNATGQASSTGDRLASMKRVLLLKLKVQRSLGRRESELSLRK
jgi:hypothetical protein